MLPEVMGIEKRQPALLLTHYQALREHPEKMANLSPCQAFAMLGQAKAGDLLEPETESHLLNKLLTHWALHHSLFLPSLPAQSSYARGSLSVI
jgi:hypothetical protein